MAELAAPRPRSSRCLAVGEGHGERNVVHQQLLEELRVLERDGGAGGAAAHGTDSPATSRAGRWLATKSSLAGSMGIVNTAWENAWTRPGSSTKARKAVLIGSRGRGRGAVAARRPRPVRPVGQPGRMTGHAHPVGASRLARSGRWRFRRAAGSCRAGGCRGSRYHDRRPGEPGPPRGVLPVAWRRPAPALRVTAFDGRTVTLESLRGRPVLVSFFESWCPICQAAQPDLPQVAREFPAGSASSASPP
jgi:hypothetical protein